MKTALTAATAAMIPLAIATASSAMASPGYGRTTMDITCAGRSITVTTAGGNDGNNWGAALVSGDGHLVLAGLEYRVDDVTAGVVLDDEVLTNGKAHGQQTTVPCEIATQQARLGDVAPDGFDYPTGTAPTDQVTMSVRATVVALP
jgi:hypothetical protein